MKMEKENKLKTKKEILSMSESELKNYKWNPDLDTKENLINCSYCSNCYDCSKCYDCSECYYCSYCRNLKDGKKHQYKVCNVQLTKKEYEKWKKNLKH